MLASLARFVHGLAHSLRSLPRGTVENVEYVSTLSSRFTGTNAFFIFTRNTPSEGYGVGRYVVGFVSLGSGVDEVDEVGFIVFVCLLHFHLFGFC